ncbi:2-succinyl-5-enolpyruvyl-6-hydroxy-3-cyclohexene-1-carboxylic-acid synthase [Sediminitomix flava]|uniref:2-succinyl-5-enolpyruvyl-6-hydroxy-3-cyclohexene-1-carboxylate synthase n=1 Tax=Sediminitomix flava TaxID=379075 RepID=A0A315Z9L9_SEDFL|nr:2-succinyl-5-enolpyruvyl-6-hydroxy-3-cyclohexene-1-carboxylic-acid synthase [Sediminitomix flava]PWJ41972.1 2-succinyl-5-enolpyruvyl-6-hydroxy-3-cyclohexene-1-carboxylate synthase [Sediminitomix flava]
MNSSTYRLNPIVGITNICAALGVEKAVLSPGSRCAPLTLAFARHKDIETISISDERSAAFIGMGMAQQSGKPVVLICTSGTAAANYYPAIIEAYYQQIPLIVLTADRPPEWIDQLDGQTIRQQNIYANHIKRAFELPVDYEHPDAKWQIDRTVSDAINIAKSYPQGPVQINIPLREPFYPMEGETMDFDAPFKHIEEEKGETILSESQWTSILDKLKDKRILLVAGQQETDINFASFISQLPFPLASDIISNFHSCTNAIQHQDAFLGMEGAEKLQADIVISFGKSVISKNLKLFIRKHKPQEHWHIQEAGDVADTFQSLRKIWRVNPKYFFQELSKRWNDSDKSYLEQWQKVNTDFRSKIPTFFKEQDFSEFEAIYRSIEKCENNTQLHLANSMSVRYANMLSTLGKPLKVWANRGASGIDGSTSSMIGHSLISNEPQLLITGDLSFMYDRNALWNNYLKSNVKILMLNNQGGVIFRMIDGPARQPELEEYFETHQKRTAELTAKDAGLAYFSVNTREEFEENLVKWLHEKDAPAILEVFTDKALCKTTFGAFKRLIPKI